MAAGKITLFPVFPIPILAQGGGQSEISLLAASEPLLFSNWELVFPLSWGPVKPEEHREGIPSRQAGEGNQ